MIYFFCKNGKLWLYYPDRRHLHMCDWDLLDRMQSKDAQAFLELTNRYGWSVYSAILSKHKNPAVADQIYNETMNAFYHSLADSPTEDPIEALLCGFAGLISPENLNFEQTILQNPDAPPTVQLCQKPVLSGQPFRPTAKWRGFRYFLGNLMITMAIAAVLWYMAALLMELGLIPPNDLGYSWFASNVGILFR